MFLFLRDQPTNLLKIAEFVKRINIGTCLHFKYRMDDAIMQVHSDALALFDDVKLVGLCDRILVMHEGRLTADLPRDKADEETIMKAAVA